MNASITGRIALAAFVSGCVVAGSGTAQAPATTTATRKPAATAANVELSPAITSRELEAHLRFLSADEQRGRMTGSPQAEACAAYLAEVFAREGLAPAGDAGTFLEHVPLVHTSVSGTPHLRLLVVSGDPIELAFGSDFSFQTPPASGTKLRVVVAKSAADLPKEASRDIALFLDAPTPDRKQWLEDAHLGRGEGFGALLVPGSEKSGKPRDAARSEGIERGTAAASGFGSVRVNGDALARLRSGSVRAIDIDPHAAREDVHGSNVVACIRGVGTSAKPELARETLVVTAHYDHLDPKHGHEDAASADPTVDTIYNGADDDASGVVAVLEIAGAMAAAKPPARTVVFVLVTGEEIGLLGTQEYLDHPFAPLENTVANLNFEMIGRPDPKVGGVGHLWLTGFDLTNLGPAFTAAKLAILPDPYPKEDFYHRSDNIAFVNRGVVGQTLSSYNLHKDYHTPRDEVDKIDFAHMEGCTKAGLAAAQLIASGDLTPEWAEKPPKREPRR